MSGNPYRDDLAQAYLTIAKLRQELNERPPYLINVEELRKHISDCGELQYLLEASGKNWVYKLGNLAVPAAPLLAWHTSRIGDFLNGRSLPDPTVGVG